MLYIISDMKRTYALLAYDGDIDAARAEFDAAASVGPNPRAYNTPEQSEWIAKQDARWQEFADKYGGEKHGVSGRLLFSPETFIGWLRKEKGARKIRFQEHCMIEFD